VLFAISMTSTNVPAASEPHDCGTVIRLTLYIAWMQGALTFNERASYRRAVVRTAAVIREVGGGSV
jgi:hypothetical protein